MANRGVFKDRFFAWLEYQDWRDGVAFDAMFSSMGWKNVFRELDVAVGKTTKLGKVKYADPNRDLEIWAVEGLPGQRGVICFPHDDHNVFMERWITDPGVARREDGKLTLVFGDEPEAKFADLLVISGHGSDLQVHGDVSNLISENKQRPPDNEMRVRDAFNKASTRPSHGRLKYLILPCCTIVGPAYAPLWIPALNRHAVDDNFPHLSDSLHGILGYAQAYAGDSDGAAVMNSFVGLLKHGITRGPDEKTILQCWAEANENTPGPFREWSAIMLTDAAKNDKMSQWLVGGPIGTLPTPVSDEVRQFDRFNTTSGRPIDSDHFGEVVNSAQPDFEARFSVPKRGDLNDFRIVDGDVQNGDHIGNNDSTVDPQLGLNAGLPGRIHLIARNKGKPLVAGETMAVIFYYYRETHQPNVDLNTLLEFRLTPSQSGASPITGKPRFNLLRDVNTRKGAADKGKFDAFNYTFNEEEATNNLAIINFIVVPTALDAYPDQTIPHTHGRFVWDVIPPKKVSDPSVPPVLPTTGVIPGVIHMQRHGVYLHNKGIL
jgi:hypothetical protein